KYLESIGVAENVARVADPAFFMEPSRPQKLPPALERGEAVGLGVSGLLAERFGDTYLASTLALLKHLCARKDTAVVIVPHVIGRDRITDDTWVCQELVRRAGAGAQVASLDPGLNASEIKYCIARCGLFVGSRTHSTIASFSSGVPTLTIAYSTKGWGVGREMLGTDAYTLDVRKLTGASLIATFEALRGDAAKLREQLAKTVPVVKEQAQRGGDLLAKLVRAKSP
ncbi:MAG TPA: polysaccharide pyruvyl transferase family protein, partial [Kiritimatiellia bacterium]